MCQLAWMIMVMTIFINKNIQQTKKIGNIDRQTWRALLNQTIH